MKNWWIKAICIFCILTRWTEFAQGQNNKQWGLNIDPTDSVIVSLMTCSPGTELYSMFGHSAIRIKNFTQNVDVVFNYGMFNYDADWFLWRFIIGETDYELGAENASEFLYRYRLKDIEIREQNLNFTKEQMSLIANLLVWNYLPENRIYRYNFLYDNCTTRARDIIEKALKESVDSCFVTYQEDTKPTTYRNILHRYTLSSPWVTFGIDLLLGEEIDRDISTRKRMFIPAIYESKVDSATIHSANKVNQTLSRDKAIRLSRNADFVNKAFPITPQSIFWGMFFAALMLSYWDWQRHRISWKVDAYIIGIQGLIGIILLFMHVFSEHPAVDSNWLLVLFNPVALLMLKGICRARRTMTPNIINSIFGLWIFIFWISLPIIPQYINEAIHPIILTLVMRAVICERIMIWRRSRERFQQKSKNDKAKKLKLHINT